MAGGSDFGGGFNGGTDYSCAHGVDGTEIPNGSKATVNVTVTISDGGLNPVSSTNLIDIDFSPVLTLQQAQLVSRSQCRQCLGPRHRYILNSAISGRWSDMRHQMRPFGISTPTGFMPRA